MTKKLLLIITAVLTLAIVFTSFIGCSGDSQSKSEPIKQADEKVQTALMVSFEGTDTKGEPHTSDEWVGKQPVVLNFWGTWCPPCRIEIPHLVELYDDYNAKGIEIVSFAFPPRDDAKKVSMFASQNNMNWVLLMGDMALAQKFQLSTVPTTIFIGKDGQFQKVWDPVTQDSTSRISGVRSKEQFQAMFEQLL